MASYWLSKFEWTDCRNYDSRTCRDGGGYAFYEDWEEISPDLYRIKYSTSSWLDYCSKTGQFVECGRLCYYFYDGECHTNYRTFSVEDLQKMKEEKLKGGWSLYKEDHHWKEWKEKEV